MQSGNNQTGKGDNKNDHDLRLLQAMKRSDMVAFTIIFRKYYSPLCAYAHKYVSLPDAEEIVQDLMINLWENRKELSIKKSLNSYLFRSVYNRALNKLTSSQIKNKVDNYFFEISQELLQDVDFYQINDLKRRLRKAIDELPDSYRDAFTKHRFLNMSYKEIASLEGVSVKTIDYRIQQALKELRIKLKDFLPLLGSLLFLE